MDTDAASLKGGFFEIHSAPKPCWNGKLVEFDRVDAAGDKLVMITLENPVMHVKIAPHMLRRPEVIRRVNEDTSPAPSLEDQPPERGTLLALHSIGEEYDDKLVEFYKMDHESSKYYVRKHCVVPEREEEWMRVKSECCLRPAMRSHSLRAFLTKLVDTFEQQLLTIKGYIACGAFPRTFKQPSLATFALVERRINTVLEIDPVCARAHLLLANLAAHRREVAKSEDEKHSLKKLGCEHQRRGIAILGSYCAQLDSEAVRQTLRKFPKLLNEAGYHKEARRRQAALVANPCSNSEIEHAEDQKALASFLVTAIYGSRKKQWYNKTIRYCLELTDPLCSIMRVASQNVDISRRMGKIAIEWSHYVLKCCKWVYDSLMQEQLSKLGAFPHNFHPTPTMTAMWKTALKIATKLLDAWLYIGHKDKFYFNWQEFKARAIVEIARGEQTADTDENTQDESQEELI